MFILRKYSLVVMVAMLISVTVLAGCGNNNSNVGASNEGNTPATNEAVVEEKPASTTPVVDEKRTVEHAMGTVTLEKKPERIVVLFNGMVDNMVALGVKPVGAVESWEEKPWYNFLRSSMEGVENIGEETQPNLEAIIALKPDLIIGAKSRHEKIYPQLSSIAPTVMTEEVFSWKNNLKLSAEALYMDDEAGTILSDWEARVAEFKQKVGSDLANTEVSIVRFEQDGSSRFYVTGFAGTIFEELGLARPKAQQQVDGDVKAVVNLTSKEQMAMLDGDYIFDITRLVEDEPTRAQAQTDWTSHPLWKNLEGVKNDKYFKVDVITWNLSAGALSANLLLDDLYKYFEIK